MSALMELGKEIKGLNDQVTGLFATIDKDQGGVGTPDQVEQIKRLNEQIEEREVSYKSTQEQDALRTTTKNRQTWLAQSAGQHTFSSDAPPLAQQAGAIKSFGEAVLGDEGFQDWLKFVSPNGKVAEKIRLNSSPVNFNCSLKTLERRGGGDQLSDAVKALVYGGHSTSGGPFVNIDYRGLPDPTGTFARPLKIRDLVTVIQTNSDTVEYVRLGAHTNAAAPVAEATATSGASGAKPESTLVTATVQDTIKTIAHWIPATRRALADAPQLRDLIDSFLRYGLAEELEDQMLAGAGTGENFTGILSQADIQTQAYDTSELISTRKGLTLAQKTGRVQPNAWIFHPDNWQTMDLLADNEKRYYFGGPMVEGTPRLWGVPVIVSEAMTTGFALLGDFRYAVLWDRMQTAIYMSDSHSDFFVRNLLAILAELRAGFGVTRPKAFVKVDVVA